MMMHERDISNAKLDERLIRVEEKIDDTFKWIKRTFWLIGCILGPLATGFLIQMGHRLADMF